MPLAKGASWKDEMVPEKWANRIACVLAPAVLPDCMFEDMDMSRGPSETRLLDEA